MGRYTLLCSNTYYPRSPTFCDGRILYYLSYERYSFNTQNPSPKSLDRQAFMLWLRKGPLMKTQTRILDNKLYYTRKIELHRKGRKSRTVRITPILICPSSSEISVLITVRRVRYSNMGKVPTIIYFKRWPLRCQGFVYFVCVFGLTGDLAYVFKPSNIIHPLTWSGS